MHYSAFELTATTTTAKQKIPKKKKKKTKKRKQIKSFFFLVLCSLIECFSSSLIFQVIFFGELPKAPIEICILIYLSYILYISKFFIHLQWHHASFMSSSAVFAVESKHILHVRALQYFTYFTLHVWDGWKMYWELLISLFTAQESCRSNSILHLCCLKQSIARLW